MAFNDLIQKLKFKKNTEGHAVKSIQQVWVLELVLVLFVLISVLIFDFLMWEALVVHRSSTLDETKVTSAAELNLTGLQNFKYILSSHQKFISNPTHPFILRDAFK